MLSLSAWSRHASSVVMVSAVFLSCGTSTPVSPPLELDPPLRVQYSYPYQDGNVVLDTSEEYLVVVFDESVPGQRVGEIVSSLGASVWASGPLPVLATPNSFEAAKALSSEYVDEVTFFGPVFEGASVITMSNPQVIVRGDVGGGRAAQLLNDAGAKLVQERSSDPQWGLFTVELREANALFDLVEELHGLPEIQYADQNFNLQVVRQP